MNDKIEDLTVNHGTAKDIRKQAIEDGMITMTQDGILRAMEGATTIEEVFRVTIE
jgi:type II secretory ATPase GspE/PulE/Tfp pilus assembly ATPase PilB-like protein